MVWRISIIVFLKPGSFTFWYFILTFSTKSLFLTISTPPHPVDIVFDNSIEKIAASPIEPTCIPFLTDPTDKAQSSIKIILSSFNVRRNSTTGKQLPSVCCNNTTPVPGDILSIILIISILRVRISISQYLGTKPAASPAVGTARHVYADIRTSFRSLLSIACKHNAKDDLALPNANTDISEPSCFWTIFSSFFLIKSGPKNKLINIPVNR